MLVLDTGLAIQRSEENNVRNVLATWLEVERFYLNSEARVAERFSKWGAHKWKSKKV